MKKLMTIVLSKLFPLEKEKDHCQVPKLLPKADGLLYVGTSNSTDILWPLEKENLCCHVMNHENC